MLCAALLVLTVGSTPAHAEDRPGPSSSSTDPTATAVPAPALPLDDALAELTDSWLFRKASVGLQVVDVETGEEVFASGADQRLNPASTMKVVTAATALKMLGPSYRFTTDLYTDDDAEIDGAGVLSGNLYVKGHGDPSFVVEKMWKLVLDLKLLGVEKVEGSVVFDESFHSGGYALPGWSKREDIKRGPTYFSTLSALSLNMNTAVLVVGPGESSGSAGRVVLETPTAGYVVIENEVRTGSAGSRRWVDIEREVSDEATTFTVSGSMPAGGDRVKYRRTVADPTAHFASAFQQMMQDQDVAVTGRYRRGTTPSDARMLVHVPSLTLGAILMDMNKFSLNFQAEQILRTLGAEIEGEGSTEAGIRVVRRYLDTLGVSEDEAVLINGSGLSREAMLEPSVLTAVLVDMAHDPQVGPEFMASLAIGGVDGTLWKRLRDEPGRLRGKTGTIDGVHCLSGYLDSDNGRRYAFAFLTNWSNSTRASSVRDVHDAFARQVFQVGAPEAD